MATKVVVFDGGTVKVFDGGYGDFLTASAGRRRGGRE